MPRIPILKLGSTRQPELPQLASYSASLSLDGLQLGIDNVRHDVWLSPRFIKAAGAHIAKLIAKHGNVEKVVEAGSPARSNMLPKALNPPQKNGELKPLLLELHRSALNRAKSAGNLSIDLLARASVIMFLRAQLVTEFQATLERCRSTLRGFEGVRQHKALEYRETVARFQIGKKNTLRQSGQELFRLLREIETETLASLRRSLFGEVATTDYKTFLHHLIFLEEGRDSYLAAEHYVLVGGFENDPDSFGNIRALAVEFLRSVAPQAEAASDAVIDGWLSAPENAHALVGSGELSERAHRDRLEIWTELLERERLMDLALAAYEVVSLLPEFTPLLDPQQLKYALVLRKEWERVAKLVEDHGRLSLKNLESAASRVMQATAAQRAKVAARLLHDFLRYHRDLRRLEALNRVAEKINLITHEKLCDLSRVNGTLYDFLLVEEQGQQEKPVMRHVILKADVRDSSRLTRSLLERNMNPASYFSLNFYDPVTKLLAKYGAAKVFVEGDAIILSILERQADPALSVARACVLGREMMEIVAGYNQLLARAGLPMLEIGVGVSFQDSAPMYLLDGEHRIMISDALNESDRLSSSDKRLRKAMGGMAVPFNVYEFRGGENPEADPIRYNVGGIRLSQAAFARLRMEISLETCQLEFPRLWGSEEMVYYSGVVAIGADVFRRIVIRAARTPVVDRDFNLICWTEASVYEICTNPAVYTAIERATAAGKR